MRPVSQKFRQTMMATRGTKSWSLLSEGDEKSTRLTGELAGPYLFLPFATQEQAGLVSQYAAG